MNWHSIRYVGFCLLLMQLGARASTILQVHDRPEDSQEESAGVLSTPQEQRGPQLDLDRDGNPIVTFKAAHKGCEAYALIPTKAAIDDGIVIRLVYNNRLPNNQKWKKDTDVLHALTFDSPIEVYYNDAGTTALHGGIAYQDTNHNWGVRLLKNDVPVKKESDYLKYIRHGYATTVPYDISQLTLDEAEYLYKRGALNSLFEKEVLTPLKERQDAGQTWSGSHSGFKLVMLNTANGEKPGIDGSLDTYLTNKSDCSKKEFVLKDGWVFVGLKK